MQQEEYPGTDFKAGSNSKKMAYSIGPMFIEFFVALNFVPQTFLQ
jgi:hypothetical protein